MIIKIGQAAKIVGVSVETMRNWDHSGELVPMRKSKSGTRYYDSEALEVLAKGGDACVDDCLDCQADGESQQEEDDILNVV
jgi:phage terminase Nu1 subunit (DNA packaging protein)